MKNLSARKKMGIIKQYLNGDSYDMIASRAGVAKGSVANIISDLMAGRFPEVQEPADQLDLLREIAVEYRKANATPERAIVGLTIHSLLQELHIEPAEIKGWAVVYRQLAGDEAKIQLFLRTALLVEEIRQQRGLTLDELEAKALSLQEDVARLEPVAETLRESEKNLRELQEREKAAKAETVPMEKRRDELRSDIAQKERREAELSQRVDKLEKRADLAEERLAAAQSGLHLLQILGLSAEGLCGFGQRVAAISQRHSIEPEVLRDRLLSELEKLDASLSLDVLVEAGRVELSKVEQDIAAAKAEKTAELAALKELRQQKAKSGRAMQRETARVRKDIGLIAGSARDAANKLTQDLTTAVANASAEVVKLTNMAIDLGRSFGRYEGIINSNEWARVFSSLINGDGEITAAQLRVACLTVLRAAIDCPRRNQSQVSLPPELAASLASAVKEMERWKP